MKKTLLFVVAVVGLAGVAGADEGMWTYNNFPRDQVKQRYGFEVTDQWLDHARLSSVRFNSGGSGSFVSATGLVMTNHHVGADCINKLGATDRDLHKDGFYARSSAEEIKCPDLELNVLTGIDDVTAQVKSVDKTGMSEAEINKAQKEKMSAIEKACADSTQGKVRCDVVTLYQGGMYNLYKYKKYTDVRLVFAPEFGIAFFGGDPDNFTFPRYDLDVTFFRAYEGGKSVAPEHFFKWSQTGAKENDLVFTSGHPGSTDRLDTLAMLETLRDVVFPMKLKHLAKLRAALQAYEKRGAEEERQARTPIFYVENSLKASTGYLQGLKSQALMAKKAGDEAALKKHVLASPDKAKTYGGSWDAIAESQKKYAALYKRYAVLEGGRGGSTLMSVARTLVRLNEEKLKPSEKRLREYRDTNLASLELALYSPAPVYAGLEEVMLTAHLERMVSELGDKDPVVVAALEGKTPAVRAKELIAGSKLADVAARKTYGSVAAVQASTDPIVKLARLIDGDARAVRQKYEDEVESVTKKNLGLIGRAIFETEGVSHYPDATFTLRLSFGKALGYAEGAKKIPWATTIGGAYERADQAGHRAPWKLPPRWVDAKLKVRPGMPFDFVSTNDIIGGNSGSPVINKLGEVVGLVFDGNIQSLVGNFVYDGAQNRATSVHSAAIIEALRQIYDAGALADELLPPPGKKQT